MQEMDPVCGMHVDTNAAQHTSEYMGKTYYFCSAGCKQDFDRDPVYYLYGEGRRTGDAGSSM